MAGASFPFGAFPPRGLPGWHWPNLSCGYRVYRGRGGLDGVDFARPVGIAQCGAGPVRLVGLGHGPAGRWTYLVRPVAGNGWLETPDVSCAVELHTDPAGNWTGPRPRPVRWLAAAVEAGGAVRLRWAWAAEPGEAPPADFALYCSTQPAVAPGSPAAVVPFSPAGTHSHRFLLEDGESYWFAVAARDAAGVESDLSRVIGPFVADAAAPAPPTVLTARTF